MSIVETHPHSGDSYKPGDYWMVCDVCGRDFRRSEMKERWDHAWVCFNDWEARNAQEGVRGIPEKIKVPIARPVPNDNNLIQNWTNITYEEFSSEDSAILSSLNSVGSGSAKSNNTGIVLGVAYNICAILDLTSGEYPTLKTGSAGASDGATLGQLTAESGVNSINFTASDKPYIYVENTAASEWSMTITMIKITTQDDL